jgi:hypothetical protein
MMRAGRAYLEFQPLFPDLHMRACHPSLIVRMKATVRKMPAGKLAASRLRADVCRMLDGVLETGVPAVIKVARSYAAHRAG